MNRFLKNGTASFGRPTEISVHLRRGDSEYFRNLWHDDSSIYNVCLCSRHCTSVCLHLYSTLVVVLCHEPF